MPRSPEVKVVPKVVTWLRESAGWSVDDVGRKIKASREVVSDIEEGKRDPTLAQLKTMSKAFKYPLTSFFLPGPKAQKPLPKDYRRLPGRPGTFGKDTLYAIRRSRYMQRLAGEMMSNLGIDARPRITRVSLGDDPKAVAARYRKKSRLDWSAQTGMRDAYDLFRYLRNSLDAMNILSFQFKIPPDEARGFVIADERPVVIAVSSRDSIEARVFTLMHELGHVLLGNTVVNNPDASRSPSGRTEKWCNKFSSSFLLPDDDANRMFSSNASQMTETGALNRMSAESKVSKAVLLLSMRVLGHISESRYRNVLGRYVPGRGAKKSISGKKMRITPESRCISDVGKRFVSLVAENFDRDLIPYVDALERLPIKAANFDKVLERSME